MIASVASGLGGRFFDELRDKRSLCYTVNAFASERRVGRQRSARTSRRRRSRKRRRATGLLAEFRRLRDEPVTAEELERAQTYAIGAHAIRQQSGGAVLADLVDAYLFGSLAELTEHDARGARGDGGVDAARGGDVFRSEPAGRGDRARAGTQQRGTAKASRGSASCLLEHNASRAGLGPQWTGSLVTLGSRTFLPDVSPVDG